MKYIHCCLLTFSPKMSQVKAKKCAAFQNRPTGAHAQIRLVGVGFVIIDVVMVCCRCCECCFVATFKFITFLLEFASLSLALSGTGLGLWEGEEGGDEGRRT